MSVVTAKPGTSRRATPAAERINSFPTRRSSVLFVFRSFPSSSAVVADSISPDCPKPEGFLVHLAGHVLLFERRPAPDFNALAGVRLLAIAIVVEALRLVAPGERAHAEGQGPLRCDRYFLICQDKLECFKHSSCYLR